ncbi:hypothetical protein Tco_1115611 [Tanacetum coccineum]
MARKNFNQLASHLQNVMAEALPKMTNQDEMDKMIADAIHQDRENLRAEISSQIHNAFTNHIPSQDDLPIWLALTYKFERLLVSDTSCRPSAVRPRDQDDPYDDAHPEGENSAKRQKTSEHESYMFGESSSVQVNESKTGPSSTSNQEQLDDFDFRTNSYALVDDKLPTEQLSQDLMDKMSQTVDEAKLRKVVDEMMRQRCTSGDKHQYYIDQMQNLVFEGLKSYNNDVKYGYVKTSLSKEDAEYLQLFEEEIKEQLKHRDQMRHWEIYVNALVDDKLPTEQLSQDLMDKMSQTVDEAKLRKVVDEMMRQRCTSGDEHQYYIDQMQNLVFEGLKSYNNDVKYGYVKTSLSKEDAEYLQLFEEEIKEQLKHRDQMRRWEIYLVVVGFIQQWPKSIVHKLAVPLSPWIPPYASLNSRALRRAVMFKGASRLHFDSGHTYGCERERGGNVVIRAGHWRCWELDEVNIGVSPSKLPLRLLFAVKLIGERKPLSVVLSHLLEFSSDMTGTTGGFFEELIVLLEGACLPLGKGKTVYISPRTYHVEGGIR